ncbi:hypothetical protein NPIL_220811 [Nephila pilipes]|uniref:Uncharacterized protein n=1 Tax=Nephila pilipes TaxID=299642 RepID=A0A8X6NI30_NEPPI|nr:hypothetical protein NPIL_220811 [Nephila pilipes]
MCLKQTLSRTFIQTICCPNTIRIYPISTLFQLPDPQAHMFCFFFMSLLKPTIEKSCVRGRSRLPTPAAARSVRFGAPLAAAAYSGRTGAGYISEAYLQQMPGSGSRMRSRFAAFWRYWSVRKKALQAIEHKLEKLY